MTLDEARDFVRANPVYGHGQKRTATVAYEKRDGFIAYKQEPDPMDEEEAAWEILLRSGTFDLPVMKEDYQETIALAVLTVIAGEELKMSGAHALIICEHWPKIEKML